MASTPFDVLSICPEKHTYKLTHARMSASGCCSYSTLKAWLPILSWLPRYKLKWLQMDLLAGITVGLTTVPQALAYAEVAGLPVQYGLYSAFMGGFIYTLLGTSKDVTLGPTAIMSLLCFSVVGGQPHRAVLLTLLCGLIQAVMALLRLGFLLDFISFPVIKGFTCAAAVTIGFGQVKNILGLKDVPHQFFLEVYYTFYKIPEARIGDVVLGLLCLAVLVMLMFMKMGLGSEDVPPCSRLARKLVWAVTTMRNALVVVAASLVAFSWDAYGHHVFTITGKTSQGLPPFRPPPTSDTMANGTVVSFGEIVEDFGGGLAVIPIMGLLESIAIAKAFASQNDYRIDANQELLAIGVTNIMGSFVSAYPVTGSFGRTAVNSQTGVCSPAGGIVTSVIVLLSLEFLMPVFYYIPKACLAAVIICAVAPMVDYHVVANMWRIRKLDLLPFVVTFLMSFWQVQYGIIAGVAVSGAMLLYNMARPQIKVSDHGVLVMELSSGLSFPATEHLSHIIHTQALQVSLPRSVVLDCHHVSVIDYTVISELRDLLRQFKLRDVQLVFSRLQPSVLEVLLAADLQGLRHTDSVEAALQMEWLRSSVSEIAL
uniref:Sodium-independent sulfate anion transporter n=1 Tax=Lates calcarifer TaxID=8187 RepID=A0A4W6CJE8_LATCA